MAYTFNVRRTDHTLTETEYHPTLAHVGGETMRFALHRTDGPGTTWVLSDIPTGIRILTVKASLRGMPVQSGCLTPNEARSAARKQLALLVEGIGLDTFKNTLETARKTYGVTQ